MAFLSLEKVDLSLSTYMQDFRTHLLPAIKPSWTGAELDGKVFDSGITNTLVAIFDKKKGLKESRRDVVLLRMNGEGTEKIVNRTDEVLCMVALNEAGLCPPVYAKLGNGLCYGYFPGRQVGVAEVREEGMSRKVACLLARLHCVEVPHHLRGRKPQVWAKISQWLTELPSHLEALLKQKSFVANFVSLESLGREVWWVQALTSSSGSPLVLCHNDTLIANFIYDDQTDEVGLVDYEYAGPNHLAFDIANHFCEFAGVDEVNFDNYPDENFQKRWLRIYLEKRAALTGESEDTVTREAVETLYKEVGKFSLASHLMWAVWALVQSRYSNIDFDYMGYAALRYGEYFRRKDSFSSL